jgi:cold shock CspA family protein
LTGIITTYLADKNYGFIKGNDQKDYFFHKSSINKDDLKKICDGALVTFDQKATPKGYNAIKISINSSSNINYKIPNEIYISKNNFIKGWDNIDVSNWLIHGSSRNSPDQAKKDMLDGVNLVGANAILNMEYYKTTGSEAGTGKGTYYYTIHNFRGRPANIGKKSLDGKYLKNDLIGIDKNAKILKKRLVERTNEAKKKRLFFWIIILFLISLSWVIILFSVSLSWVLKKDTLLLISGGWIFLGFIFSHATNYDSWLEEIT